MYNKFISVIFLLLLHGIGWTWIAPKLFDKSLNITEINYDFLLEIIDILYIPIIILLLLAWVYVHF